MSFLRRWLDPIHSKWFYKKPTRQDVLPIDQGLTIHLRLDDVYSYLIVQQLAKLNEILVDELKPLKIVISKHVAVPPNNMTAEEWQNYTLNDAKNLAKQHGFGYDDQPELPSQSALEQAEIILKNTPLRDEKFLYLLEDVFHMLWQQQYGKLRILYVMASTQHKSQQFPERTFNQDAILASYFEFGGKKYNAFDDLLRLTRRLKQQKLLTDNPIFLINHIEWREHLINDAEELADIQAMQPELDLYIALEDPISWLLLSYIKEELAEYYNIQLRIYPLSYHGRDQFDWPLAVRLSKRTKVAFTPFCRPTEHATSEMAKLFYSVDDDAKVDTMYHILEAAWVHGKDLSYKPHVEAVRKELSIDRHTEQDVQARLKQNDIECLAKHQPNFPVLVLRVQGRVYTFNSLYRVWMIESILSQVLEKYYQSS
ncbi:hypothetical protein [Acinetobacter pollinis]|uniref:hypothetical protein n=1 Tax=Acinetobacter pollinis TaxID=2605270 RepID=UPI0018C31F2E|nr:hypothetical protein [Acinetobacter pollinis]MBF7693532.1 hypothetical protein [Acinetobacter pollinis]MBF7701065.1 hypothetical protein [Acinetobacter pollinis]